MKIFSILTLALIGSGLVATGQRVEQYKYHGKIMTGVLNPRQTFAGSALDLDLFVHRGAEKSEVEFKNPKSVEFNRLVYLADPPNHDHPITSVPDLEGKIHVYFNREHGVVMEVPQNEPNWVTNIRKAIVSMLRVPPYLGDQSFISLEQNIFRHAGSLSSSSSEEGSYFKTEETYAGRCNVSYTMNRDYDEGRWPETPSYVLPTGDFFRLRRSVDYSSCHDPVVFQKTSYGNFSNSYKSEFQDVQQRSVLGEYLLKKDADGKFEIKGMQQTGEQTVRPFGQDTGHLVTFTNQTLSLFAVSGTIPPSEHLDSRQREQLQSNMKEIKTWKYQFVSPAEPHQDTQVDWVIYQGKSDKLHPIYTEYAILGEPSASQDTTYQKITTTLLEICQLQRQHNDYHNMPYNGTADGRVTEMLSQLTRMMRSLNKETFDKVYKKYVVKWPADVDARIKKQVVVDTSIASGSSAAIKQFLEAIQSGSVDTFRVGTHFATLVNNIVDPASMKDLMDFVMKQDVRHDMHLATLAYLNFATLANRVCVDPDIKKYAVAQSYLGKKICQNDMIETNFVDHLIQKIRTSDSLDIEDMVYIQSLGCVGSERSIPFISDIAHGKKNENVNIRLTAINALVHNFHQVQAKEKIVDQLQGLAESHAERFEIRESAFMALVTLMPNETFVQRFAMDSWRDPSVHMRAMVTSTFISLANSNDQKYHKLINIVRKYLPLMKTVDPSLSNSLFFNKKIYIPNYKISVESSVAWLTRYRFSVSTPRQIQSDLKANFGGIEVPLFKMLTMFDTSSLMSSRLQRNNTRAANQGRNHQEDSMRTEQSSLSKNSIYSYISSLNMQTFFAYDSRTKEFFQREVVNRLVSDLNKGEKPLFPDHLVSYVNPVDITIVLPTPFGLPCIVEVTAPTNLFQEMTYAVTLPSQDTLFDISENNLSHRHMNITVNGNVKMTIKPQTYMSVLVPWQKKTVSAAFDTETTVSLPGKYSILANHSHPYVILKTTISPIFTQERPILYYRSKPLSVVRPMGPISDVTMAQDLITPIANKTASYNKPFYLSKRLFGLQARVTYQGDTDDPLHKNIILNKMFNSPFSLVTLLTTPTEYDCALAFRLNIDQSETKNISIATVFDLEQKLTRAESTNKSAQQLIQTISTFNSPEAKVREAQEAHLQFIISTTVNYTAPNVLTRQYEFSVLGHNRTTSNSQTLVETIILILMRKGIPGDDGERKICLTNKVMENLKPKHPENKESSGLFDTIETKIYAGQTCQSQDQLIHLESLLYLNDGAKKHNCSTGVQLSDKEEDLLPCERSYTNSWIDHAVYDQMNSELTWVNTTAVPLFYQNLTNFAEEYAKTAVFPHYIHNPDPAAHHPQRKTIVNVTRSLQDGGGVLNAWIHRSTEMGYIQSLPVSGVFDWITPLIGNRMPYIHRFNKRSPSNRLSIEGISNRQCSIFSDRVITFDGVHYGRKPCSCFTVAAHVHHEDNYRVVYTRQVRHSAKSAMEVKILSYGMEDIEILNGSAVNIDGLPVNESMTVDGDDGICLNITLTPNEVYILVYNDVEVILKNKNKLSIKLDDGYKAGNKGLCGDFNGQKYEDLKSPKRCIYTPRKGSLFATSYIYHKKHCRDYAMHDLIRQSEEHEKYRCHKPHSRNQAL